VSQLDPFAAWKAGVEGIFQTQLDDRERRQAVVRSLMRWLSEEARKKPVPDLAQRLERMEGRIKKMVENMTIEVKDDKLAVKTAGSDEDTWRMFRLGTDWFESNPDLMETVLCGLFRE
jgi:hypothetical protein